VSLQAVLQVEDPRAATAQFLQVVAGAVAAAQPPQRTAPGQSQPKDALWWTVECQQAQLEVRRQLGRRPGSAQHRAAQSAFQACKQRCKRQWVGRTNSALKALASAAPLKFCWQKPRRRHARNKPLRGTLQGWYQLYITSLFGTEVQCNSQQHGTQVARRRGAIQQHTQCTLLGGGA
jgi:hypothetical protein